MSDLVPGPSYRITTPRLVVRCWDPRDAGLLHAAIAENLDHLRPWLPWARDEPKRLEDRVGFLRKCRGQFDLGNEFMYGIFDPTETQVLGGTGLHTRVGPAALEIGYWIHHAHIGRGLASEAVAALTRVAFEVHRVTWVEIRCASENARSAAIPRKVGFTHEATLRGRPSADETHRSGTMIWTLFAEEYPTSPCASASVNALDVVGGRLL